MSETETTNEVDVEVEKTVQIVAYLNEDYGSNPRLIASSVYPNKDWWSQHTMENSSYFVERGDDRRSISTKLYEMLKGTKMEGASVIEEVETEQVHDMREKKFAKMVMSEVFEELPEEMFGVFKRSSGIREYADDSFNLMLKVYSYTDEMGLLKHPSEITPSDMYEMEGEFPVLKWKFKVENVNSEQMEEVNERIIKPVVARLVEMGYIERVRWYDCKVQTTEEGQCLNI